MTLVDWDTKDLLEVAWLESVFGLECSIRLSIELAGRSTLNPTTWRRPSYMVGHGCPEIRWKDAPPFKPFELPSAN
jgi:hypothetical protein